MHHGGKGDRHSPGTHTEVSEGKVPNKLVAPIVERSVPKQCSQYQSITCSNWGGLTSSNWGGLTSSNWGGSTSSNWGGSTSKQAASWISCK